MNCDTYLAMLSTLPMDELSYGDARAHAATCRDCDRVTRVVVERERSMVLAFDTLAPAGSSSPVAERALMLARRRRIALFYRIGLGIAAAAMIPVFIMSRRPGPARADVISETFRLQCLSPAQAAEILRPIRSNSASISIRETSPLGVIKVSARPAEMERLQSVLDRYDNPSESQCDVQVTVPEVITVPMAPSRDR